MTADPRMIGLMSYYRDAELHGATLLLRLIKLMDDPDAQVKLVRHLADEARHARLWTKRITDLGGMPMKVLDGYQSRIGMRALPHSLVDLLALTVVAEERALARYQEHAARPDVDAETCEVLHEVTKDENWHIEWVRAKLMELAAREGGAERAYAALARYQEIDRQVYAELRAKEIVAFGQTENRLPSE